MQIHVLDSKCASHAPPAMRPVVDDNSYGNFIRYCQEATDIQSLKIPKNATGALLHGNFITRLTPNDFKHIQYIFILDLAYNYIQKIEHGSFNGVRMLQHLYLGHNNISVLDERVFSKLYKLIVLDLSHNKMEDLPYNLFHGLKNLLGLYVCCNKLKILQQGVLDHLYNLMWFVFHLCA